MKNKCKLLIIILSLLLLIGCSQNDVTGKVISEKPNEPVSIGGMFMLTSFGAAWGESEFKGVQMAVDEVNSKGGINGKKIELIVEEFTFDDKSAISALRKLNDIDRVEGVVGATFLESIAGSAALADELGIPIITSSGSITALTAEQEYDYVFSTWYRADSQFRALLKYLSENDMKRVVLFFGKEAYWEDIIVQVKRYADDYDIEIVKEYKFNTGETDYRGPLAQMKNEIRPDVILFGLNNQADFLSFLKQRKEVYPELVLFTETTIEGFVGLDSFKEVLDDVYLISPEYADEEFTTRYSEKYGEAPILSASTAYDATMILIKAIEGSGRDPEKIKEYLMENEFETITHGRIRFDEIGGVVGGNFVIKLIDDEEVKFIAET